MDELMIAGVVAGIAGLLFLAGWLENGLRARRWESRARTLGPIACVTCGVEGAPVVRTVSGGEAASADLRLACSRCGSSHWRVPGAPE